MLCQCRHNYCINLTNISFHWHCNFISNMVKMLLSFKSAVVRQEMDAAHHLLAGKIFSWFFVFAFYITGKLCQVFLFCVTDLVRIFIDYLANLINERFPNFIPRLSYSNFLLGFFQLPVQCHVMLLVDYFWWPMTFAQYAKQEVRKF